MAAATAAAGGVTARGADQCPQLAEERAITKGRIKQSVVNWCFDPMPPETLAWHAAAIGLSATENVPPKDWGILKRHGLLASFGKRGRGSYPLA